MEPELHLSKLIALLTSMLICMLDWNYNIGIVFQVSFNRIPSNLHLNEMGGRKV